MRQLHSFVFVTYVIALGACANAGSDSDGDGSEPGVAGSGSGSGSNDDLFGNADGANGPHKPGGAIAGAAADPGMSDDPLTGDNACAASSLAAEQVVIEQEVEVEIEVPVEVEVQVEVPVEVEVEAPVAMYVMFDKSLSMSTGGLWTPAVNAMSGFLQSADSSGIDVALQYFPIGGGSCSTGAGYKTPAVGLGRLPSNADALVSSLDEQNANGIGTPIEGALRGVTEYCKTFQQNNGDERCVAVLVTDGKPELASGCSEDDDTLAAIAGDAWTQHQVKTFAVGLQGADFTLLDKIALQGGAVDCAPNSARFACDISGGADQLSAALAKIRDTIVTTEIRTETRIETQIETHTEIQKQMVTKQVALECEWAMPEVHAGVEVDPTRVNVRASGGEGGELALGRVPDADHCADNGWYYDNAIAPSRLIACQQTCDAIQSGGHTAIEVLLGCATKEIVVQ
jgi:hypothetical protein